MLKFLFLSIIYWYFMHFLDICKLQGFFSVLIWDCFVLSWRPVNWGALYPWDGESGASFLTHCELGDSCRSGDKGSCLRDFMLHLLSHHTVPQPGRDHREWQEEFKKPFRTESPDMKDSAMSPFAFCPFFVSICSSFHLWDPSPAGWNNPVRNFKINNWILHCISENHERNDFYFSGRHCPGSVGGGVQILWIFSLEKGEASGFLVALSHVNTHHHMPSCKCMNLLLSSVRKCFSTKSSLGDFTRLELGERVDRVDS